MYRSNDARVSIVFFQRRFLPIVCIHFFQVSSFKHIPSGYPCDLGFQVRKHILQSVLLGVKAKIHILLAFLATGLCTIMCSKDTSRMFRKPKILVIGHARHGKDTVAELLQAKLGLTCTSSSLQAAKTVVYPVLKSVYGYTTVQECFEDRGNHRQEWFELICAYNRDDPSKLAKVILSTSDIYIGLRSRREFEASRKLFDFIIWVDASTRLPPEPLTSMELAITDADTFIFNNGSLSQLHEEMKKIYTLVSAYNKKPVPGNSTEKL